MKGYIIFGFIIGCLYGVYYTNKKNKKYDNIFKKYPGASCSIYLASIGAGILLGLTLFYLFK